MAEAVRDLPGDNTDKSEGESPEEALRLFTQHRDEAAFRRLVRFYLPSIRRILYSALPWSREDREDAEQEVLLALYRSLPRFAFRSGFRTYLFRLCRNKAADQIRKSRRSAALNDRAGRLEEEPGAPGPEELYLRREQQDRIRRAVFRLKERDRSLLILKDAEGLDLKELARIFRVPPGTVKSRLHRARLKAAEIMIQEGLDEK